MKTPRPWQRVLTEAQEARVAAMYEAGWSIRALAAEFGCSTSPIVKALDAYQIEMRRCPNPSGRRGIVHRPRARPQTERRTNVE